FARDAVLLLVDPLDGVSALLVARVGGGEHGEFALQAVERNRTVSARPFRGEGRHLLSDELRLLRSAERATRGRRPDIGVLRLILRLREVQLGETEVHVVARGAPREWLGLIAAVVGVQVAERVEGVHSVVGVSAGSRLARSDGLVRAVALTVVVLGDD